MKEDNAKIVELNKLRKLVPYPLNASFISGYFGYIIPEHRVEQLKNFISQCMTLIEDHLISSFNLLELIVVTKY